MQDVHVGPEVDHCEQEEAIVPQDQACLTEEGFFVRVEEVALDVHEVVDGPSGDVGGYTLAVAKQEILL